jgi:ABC-type tungstate transport system permease subunit
VLALAVALLCIFLLPAVPAHADTSTTLTVVGTSDVSDSGLVPNLIQPDFQKAYPQYTFKYIGTATGTAISDAESGSVGASALIVHAASLENQFVAGGYSYEEYGRAIFTNDFVLAGPTSDPAGLGASGAHNIAQAFADIATAGISGKVTFVSRGGTPGTTVEEHKIWGLVQTSGLAPTGLLLCVVNATDGGGETPIAPGNGVTASGQPCPNGGVLPTGTQLPSWYVATGLTQGPNVVAANACTGHPSGASSCYVLTDRGTYDYLASGTDPAGAIPNLTILTRDDSASAPGGADGLINYFHAYIVNPSKPGETVNLTAAQDFVNLLTSPAFQAQLKGYLPTSDSGGPPFVADAAPIITEAGIPHTYHAGKPVKVTGTLTNAEPGYPPLAGQKVTVDEVAGALTLPIASGKTNASGAYTIDFVPPTTGSYELTTAQIAQIEDATLNPVFGDLLSPAATASVPVTVRSAIYDLTVKLRGGRALVTGSVAPGTGHAKASVKVLARLKGSKRGYQTVATHRLSASDGNFAVLVALSANSWQIKVSYQDPRQVVASTSGTVNVTVGAAPTSSVSFGSLKVSNGALTLGASVRPAAPSSGAKVELLAFKTAGGSPRFGDKATVTVRGKTKVTLHAKLGRGFRWVLELEYIQRGQASSFSALRTINVP